MDQSLETIQNLSIHDFNASSLSKKRQGRGIILLKFFFFTQSLSIPAKDTGTGLSVTNSIKKFSYGLTLIWKK
jgi:hypothetical protein